MIPAAQFTESSLFHSSSHLPFGPSSQAASLPQRSHFISQ